LRIDLLQREIDLVAGQKNIPTPKLELPENSSAQVDQAGLF